MAPFLSTRRNPTFALLSLFPFHIFQSHSTPRKTQCPIFARPVSALLTRSETVDTFPLARATVWLCLLSPRVNFLAPELHTTEVSPKRPPITPRGTPTITPNPVSEVPNPLADRATESMPVATLALERHRVRLCVFVPHFLIVLYLVPQFAQRGRNGGKAKVCSARFVSRLFAS